MKRRPLSARSVVLSLLLAKHPPEFSAGELVALGEHFGISESTLRVALTRMVGNGDLTRAHGSYRLSDRMVERQRRQDAALYPGLLEWDGTWETVIITAAKRSAPERADLRVLLAQLRLAELREGVWLRPANLARPLPEWPVELLTPMRATPGEPVALADRLFDPRAWHADVEPLLKAMASAEDNATEVAAAAAIVRHLRTDPALPEELLPTGWAAAQLRATYEDYQRKLAAHGIEIHPAVPD